MATRGFRVLLIDREREESVGHDRRDIVENDAFELSCVERPMPPESLPGFVGIEVLVPDSTGSIRLTEFPYLVVNRRLFASRLLGQARRAGAELLSQCIAGEAEVNRGFVTAVATDRGTFRCRLAVDASGLERALCRTFPRGMGIPRQLSPRDYVTIYREARGPGGDPEDPTDPGGFIRYYIDHSGGYSWVQADSGSHGIVDFGAAVQDGPASPDPREVVMDLIASTPGVCETVTYSGGGRVPARKPLNTMVAPGLLVIGDAACQAVPMACRGVGSAMTAATMAADAAAFALEARDVSPEGLWAYNYNYMRERGAYTAALDCMRIFIQALPEKEFLWFLARGVIDESDIAMALMGRFGMPNAQARVRNMLKGLADVPMLLRFDGALKQAQRVLDHYLDYPREYDAPAYAEWSREADYLFEDAQKLTEKVLLYAGS
jgi:electron-transferring-flavoprotein dehydrogenase